MRKQSASDKLTYKECIYETLGLQTQPPTNKFPNSINDLTKGAPKLCAARDIAVC